MTSNAATLLPIAIRELRVSARSKATHRWRIGFALGAVVVALGLELISQIGRGSLTARLGTCIFETLRWIGFVYVCGAGIFLTADCVSEEKREGTLGLLFLTDLRGYDVVLGKLTATSLRSFYSLLAIFPVMAFSFFLGGVAVDDFWHSLIALCNTLFLSLALGMFISVCSRDAHKAMTGALVVMTVWIFALGQTLFSPVYPFLHTNSYYARDYWQSTMLLHLAGWVFLAAASWLAPKTWHEKRTTRQFEIFGRAAGDASGRELRDRNPVAWLVARDRWAANLGRLAVIAILVLLVLIVISLGKTGAAGIPPALVTVSTTTTNGYGVVSSTIRATSPASNVLFGIATACAGLLSLALEVWIALHVARFYVDGKTSGFLELLLVSPVQPAEILRGHWAGLRRLFLLPVSVVLVLTLGIGWIQAMASPPAAAGSVLPSNGMLEQVVGLALRAVSWVVGLYALVWFSIWMGLDGKRIPTAVLKTFCYTKILPWLGIMFATGMLAFPVTSIMATVGSPNLILLLITSMPQMLYIAVACCLIALARRRAAGAFSRIPSS